MCAYGSAVVDFSGKATDSAIYNLNEHFSKWLNVAFEIFKSKGMISGLLFSKRFTGGLENMNALC